MLKKYFILFLLSAMFMLQTSVLFADVYNLHLSEDSHQHSDAIQVVNADSINVADHQEELFDCHHSCHGHGVSYLLFRSTAQYSLYQLTAVTPPLKINKWAPLFISPDLRPPIF